MGQGCRLFKWCQNLPPGHCGAGCRLFKQFQNLPSGHSGVGMKDDKAVSEPSSRALLGRAANCKTGVGTFLLGTVGKGCRLFKRCQNLPPGHSGAGVQAVKAMWETTSQALWGRDAAV